MFYYNYNKTFINIYINEYKYKLNLYFFFNVKIEFKFILKYNEIQIYTVYFKIL